MLHIITLNQDHHSVMVTLNYMKIIFVSYDKPIRETSGKFSVEEKLIDILMIKDSSVLFIYYYFTYYKTI
jgi:hypothetical protein